MKNIFKITILLLLHINSKAQTIVHNNTFNQGSNTGKYFKDLDNNIPAFEGTWQNTTSNITFRIILYKETMLPFGSPVDYYSDNMGGSFQIIRDINTANEVVLHNSVKTYTEGSESFTMSSVFFADASTAALGGWVRDNCANGGDGTLVGFFRLVRLSPTTAHWKVKPGAIKFSFQYYSIPTDVIMTKIN